MPHDLTIIAPQDMEQARTLHQELKDLSRSATVNFFRMGKILTDIEYNQYYKVLGHDTFRSYLADPEFGFNPKSVERAIRMIRYFPDYDRLLDIPYRKLFMIAPLMTDENREELIGMARALASSDLQVELRRFKSPDEPQVDPLPKIYRCKGCNGVKGLYFEDLCRCGYSPEAYKELRRQVQAARDAYESARS